jgi:hypothetical protein
MGVPLSEFRTWHPEDAAVVVALVLEDRDRCPGCGHPLSETTAKGASGRYTLTEAMCAGCEVGEAVAKGKQYPGRLVSVTRKPGGGDRG